MRQFNVWQDSAARFALMLELVCDDNETLELTKNKKPVAVIMSKFEYDRLNKELERLNNA